MTEQRSKIATFLFDPKNSLTREKLITYHICYQIQLAAAQLGEPLEIYLPEIDQNGYDVIIRHDNKIMPFQLKSSVGKVSNWHIQRQLLRPVKENVDLVDFESSPAGIGANGGVVLVEITPHGDLEPTYDYYYTDCFIMHLVKERLLQMPKAVQVTRKTLRLLRDGSKTEKLKVSKSCFVKMKSFKDLLTCAGVLWNGNSLWRAEYKQWVEEGRTNTSRKETFLGILDQCIDDHRLQRSEK